MPHKWMNWFSMVQNGRIRRLTIEQPKRERVLVRKALSLLGYHYRELVPVKNFKWHGWKGNQVGGTIQWLDFLYYTGGKMYAILFDPHHGSSGVKPHEWENFYAKQAFLTDRGIHYIILKRKYTAQEFTLQIRKFTERHKGDA
jgi:hypothetical protein